MSERSTTLYLKEGGTDKVYQASITARGDGFSVDFAFGRRGSALKAGTKTETPVPLAEAQRLYSRLVAEKQAKGYSEGEAGVRFEGTEKAGRKTQYVPQLLNDVEDLDAVVADPGFWAQEKYDGNRVLIERSDATVTGINRSGLAIPLTEDLVHQVRLMGAEAFVLDGELVGSTYFPFDVIAGPGVTTSTPYSARLMALEAIAGCVPPTARTQAEKQDLLAQVRARGGEGVVFKRHDAAYTPGRPNSGGNQLKNKFTQSASCIVLGAKAGRRSVEVGLHDKDGLRGVGFVTVPANYEMPAAGAIGEVRYLYANPGGGLQQPVYLGTRTDIEASACTTTQLKLKAAPEGDES